MSDIDLTPVGFNGYKIDRNGNVYGRQGKPLMYQYTSQGFRSVNVRASNGKKKVTRIVRIDRLLGAAFQKISIDDNTVQPVYKDGYFNNVTIDNLIFARK